MSRAATTRLGNTTTFRRRAAPSATGLDSASAATAEEEEYREGRGLRLPRSPDRRDHHRHRCGSRRRLRRHQQEGHGRSGFVVSISAPVSGSTKPAKSRAASSVSSMAGKLADRASDQRIFRVQFSQRHYSDQGIARYRGPLDQLQADPHRGRRTNPLPEGVRAGRAGPGPGRESTMASPTTRSAPSRSRLCHANSAMATLSLRCSASRSRMYGFAATAPSAWR